MKCAQDQCLVAIVEQTRSDREGFIQKKLPMYMYNQVYDSTCTGRQDDEMLVRTTCP